MIKKLILILISVALVILTYNTVTEGFEFENIEILSYKQLQEENQNLDQKVMDLNTLINRNYAARTNEVSTSKTNFRGKKQEYESLASEATDEQLEAAMREEEFLLDYLWILVGNYANDNDVKFLMNVNDNFSIDFDITGSYISVINFIYDLASDPELRFVIDNIQLEGGSDKNAVTKAKFTVEGINVVTKIEEE